MPVCGHQRYKTPKKSVVLVGLNNEIINLKIKHLVITIDNLSDDEFSTNILFYFRIFLYNNSIFYDNLYINYNFTR